MKSKLFIKNLSFNTEAFDLKKLFSEFGTVISIDVPKDKGSGRNKGISFVEMQTPEEATEIITKLHDTIFKDYKIKIEYAKDQK